MAIIAPIRPFDAKSFGATVKQTAQPTTFGAPRVAAKSKLAFKPVVNVIPSGLFDPTREMNIANGATGAYDKEQDLAGPDGQKQVSEDNYTQALEALKREGVQGNEDIATQRGQDETAYNTSVQNLTKGFANLAARQGEQANQAGVLGGGALLQAAAKRAVNQGTQQAALDTAHAQTEQALQTRAQRLAEGQQLGEGKLTQGEGRELSNIQKEVRRTKADQTQFRVNERQLEGDEAAARGYSPQTVPSNQFTNSSGQVYRTVVHGNQVLDVMPSGVVLSRRPRGK